jgi:hypothetical protein
MEEDSQLSEQPQNTDENSLDLDQPSEPAFDPSAGSIDMETDLPPVLNFGETDTAQPDMDRLQTEIEEYKTQLRDSYD